MLYLILVVTMFDFFILHLINTRLECTLTYPVFTGGWGGNKISKDVS